jgi:hypothetical protein
MRSIAPRSLCIGTTTIQSHLDRGPARSPTSLPPLPRSRLRKRRTRGRDGIVRRRRDGLRLLVLLDDARRARAGGDEEHEARSVRAISTRRRTRSSAPRSKPRLARKANGRELPHAPPPLREVDADGRRGELAGLQALDPALFEGVSRLLLRGVRVPPGVPLRSPYTGRTKAPTDRDVRGDNSFPSWTSPVRPRSPALS